MKSDKLDYIINIGTNLEDSILGVGLAEKYDNVYSTIGIHPEYAHLVNLGTIDRIEVLVKNKKVVAIGEIGLDYHYEINPQIIAAQKEIFISQLKLANKYNLPVVIHCRDAADDILEIFNNHKHLLNNGICMHCYSEGKDKFKDFAKFDCYFSFTGNITYKKTDRSYLKDLDKERIMVETDCPYLSPEPLRGTINEPKNVLYTAQKIADELQMDLQDFEKLTTLNTKRFFRIK